MGFEMSPDILGTGGNEVREEFLHSREVLVPDADRSAFKQRPIPRLAARFGWINHGEC